MKFGFFHVDEWGVLTVAPSSVTKEGILAIIKGRVCRSLPRPWLSTGKGKKIRGGKLD